MGWVQRERSYLDQVPLAIEVVTTRPDTKPYDYVWWTWPCQRCAWGKIRLSLSEFRGSEKYVSFPWQCLQKTRGFRGIVCSYCFLPERDTVMVWREFERCWKLYFFNLQWENDQMSFARLLTNVWHLFAWYFKVFRSHKTGEVKDCFRNTLKKLYTPYRTDCFWLGLHAFAWHEYQSHLICVLESLTWVKRLVNALKYIPLLLVHDLMRDPFWELWNVPCLKFTRPYKVRWDNGKTMSC